MAWVRHGASASVFLEERAEAGVTGEGEEGERKSKLTEYNFLVF